MAAGGAREVDEIESAISREFLARGGLEEMLARTVPELRIWTEAERAASIAAVMAANPAPGEGVWLFAYGSLMWNPTVHVARRVACRVTGWHRAFSLLARAGRGSAERPGLLLGLVPGRSCDGIALQVAEAELQADLALLWRREMVAGSYVPTWLPLDPQEGAPSHAIAFTIDTEGRNYAGDLAEDEVVQRLATARGELGTCADYLMRTRAALRESGINDPDIERLAERVLQVGV
jgi:cation transport protein ChaC